MQPEKSTLLNELRIERDDVPTRTPRRRSIGQLKIAVAIVTILVIIATLTWPRESSQAVPSETVAAQSATDSPPAMTKGSLLDASGYVVARRRATVSAKVSGKVMELLIEEGRRIEAGEVMARLDDSNYRAAVQQAKAQFAQAEASLTAARTAFEDAQPIFKRNEQQKAGGLISAQAFDTAKATFNASRTAFTVAERGVDSARATLAFAQRNLDDTVVRAPFAGVITEKAAQPGEIVSPMSAGGGFTRTGIGTIVDMDSLEVEVDVSESFINRVSANQPVTVRLNAYPDWEIAGEVIATIPTADRAKATVKVRIGLNEKDPRVIPEMGARVSFLSESAVPAMNTKDSAHGDAKQRFAASVVDAPHVQSPAQDVSEPQP